MNKQTKLGMKRAKRKKKIAIQKQNKAVMERTRNKQSGQIRIDNKILDEKTKENMSEITKKLRQTLGLPEDDKTPIGSLVEAVNLKMKQMKPKEKEGLNPIEDIKKDNPQE